MRISDGSSDVCSSDLSPVKRRGNRRYYQRHDVLMVRQIRGLLYEQGYTIGGARQLLEGEGAKQESALSTQIVKQVRMELEAILQLLPRSTLTPVPPLLPRLPPSLPRLPSACSLTFLVAQC